MQVVWSGAERANPGPLFWPLRGLHAQAVEDAERRLSWKVRWGREADELTRRYLRRLEERRELEGLNRWVKAKPEKRRCIWTAGRNGPCRNPAAAGSPRCRVHGRIFRRSQNRAYYYSRKPIELEKKRLWWLEVKAELELLNDERKLQGRPRLTTREWRRMRAMDDRVIRCGIERRRNHDAD